MGNDMYSFESPDYFRLGRRLWRYLNAKDKFTSSVLNGDYVRKRQKEKKIDCLLREALPTFCDTFDSEMAFVANAERKIKIEYPEGGGLIKKKLPPTKALNYLINTKKPILILKTEEDDPRELRDLGVDSLLMVHLETPGSVRIIGVCNGTGEASQHPDESHWPYQTEDKKFFNYLMKVISVSFFHGRKEEEKHFFSKHYCHARIYGKYGYLARAGKDFAFLKLGKKLVDVNGDNNEGANNLLKLFDDDGPDSVLADSLDAELCKVMRDPPVTREDPNIGIWTRLLKCCKSVTDIPRNSLPAVIRRRTNLAVARVYLWAGWLHTGSISKFGFHSTSSKKAEEWEKKAVEFNILCDELLIATEKSLKGCWLNNTLSGHFNTFEWQLDWVRTLWQRVHCTARMGALEPVPELIRKIYDDYQRALPLTIQILQSYLKAGFSIVDGKDQLRVDSDWLIAWLASNVLLSKSLKEHYGLFPGEHRKKKEDKYRMTNPMAKMRFLMHLSHHVLYSLHCSRHRRREDLMRKSKPDVDFRRPPFMEVPVDLTSSLTEAQLYVLGEYAYREIGIHRELRIFERLIRQLHYELPLYASSSFYRDHLYHVMDVCLLGELLLRSTPFLTDGPSRRRMLVEDAAMNSGLGLGDSLLQNWYVAALCHDLGYVVEQADKLLNPIKAINGNGLDEFAQKAREGLEKGEKAIRRAIERNGAQSDASIIPGLSVKELKKILRSVNATDHGVVACLHLLQWLQEIQKAPESLAPGLIAILRHNIPVQNIDIGREPLTLLLMLCDHMQEWGRPRIGPNPMARGVMEAMRFSEQPHLERKVHMHQIHIGGLSLVDNLEKEVPETICDKCTHDYSVCKKRKHCRRITTKIDFNSGLDFKLEHLEAREADFEPGISWLLLCRDLQGLAFRKEMLPFNITISLKHAPPRTWRILPVQLLEMDTLEEFANTQESATYLCEWIESARRGKGGIHYKVTRKNGEETFIIKLHELGRPLGRGLSDEHWKPYFSWKWKWLGQKFVNLSLGPWFPRM